MSAIFGRVHLDGRPVAPDCLDAATAELAAWGPDGGGAHVAGAAALGCRRLRVTPEPDDGAPLLTPDGCVLVASARLDNRSELLDLLDVPAELRTQTPDVRLLGRAFARWGDDCPGRLLGDWSFAAWDPRRARLLLARDRLGNQGLFYAQRAAIVAFASASWAVPSLSGDPRRIDEEFLLDYLTLLWSGDCPARSPFAGVRQVLPATSVAIDRSGLRETVYWRPFTAPPLRLSRDADYVDLFLDRFRAAVRSRLRSSRPIAATLSAGLDSSAVTALGAGLLAERGQPLLAFTSAPALPTPARSTEAFGILDEWPHARAVADRFANVEHVRIHGLRVSPVGALGAALEHMLHPQHGVGNLYWILDLLAEARARSVGVLLTGQLGNAGVSWDGGRSRVLYLLAAGRFAEGRRLLHDWKERHGSTWVQALHAHVVSPLLRPLAFRARMLATPSPDPGLLEPDLARRIDLRARARRSVLGSHAWPPPRPEAMRARTLTVNAAIAGPLWHAFGARHGLEVRDPTSDVRLIEACGAMPAEQDARDGLDRSLIRRATLGLLPDEVRLETRRGRQAADLPARLLTCREEVDAALEEARGSAFVSQARLREEWALLARDDLGASARRAASLCLLRGLMATMFLARAEAGEGAAGERVRAGATR